MLLPNQHFPLVYFHPLFLALQMVLEPRAIKNWAIVNFSFPCDSSHISRELISCGMSKGIVGSRRYCLHFRIVGSVERYLVINRVSILLTMQEIDRPFALVEEDPQSKNLGAVKRVEKMIAKMKSKFPVDPPQFILCVLPERKNSDIYGMIQSSHLFCVNFEFQLSRLNWSLQIIKVPGRRFVSLKQGSTHNASAPSRSVTNISPMYF